jgi:hypothetical protein
MKTYKRHRDYGFWDHDLRLSRISQLGDLLEKLNEGVNFELFRSLLEDRLSKLSKGPSGRPPCDYMLMSNILIIQQYCNLSDDQVEFQTNDRLSSIRFIDMNMTA